VTFWPLHEDRLQLAAAAARASDELIEVEICRAISDAPLAAHLHPSSLDPTGYMPSTGPWDVDSNVHHDRSYWKHQAGEGGQLPLNPVCLLLT
jgi:hypothetical protein